MKNYIASKPIVRGNRHDTTIFYIKIVKQTVKLKKSYPPIVPCSLISFFVLSIQKKAGKVLPLPDFHFASKL